MRRLHSSYNAEVRIMFRRNPGILLTLIVVLVLGAAIASAQVARGATATVAANAPIYLAAAVSPTPLRVAAPGTVLKVLQQEGDWLQVEFNDPQWGAPAQDHRTMVAKLLRDTDESRLRPILPKSLLAALNHVIGG
jgi:hypothetical protein